jgi:O-antigen biosynthesis protein
MARSPDSRSLFDILHREVSSVRICLVTEEFVGVTLGGGIGACFAGLGRLLAQNGHEVHVLITSPPNHTPDVDTYLSWLHAEGIVVSFVSEIPDAGIAASVPHDGHDNIIKSYRSYRIIERQKFDIVHFHDYLGIGFYTAMARRQGLIQSVVITQTHGSSEWVRRYNLGLPDLGSLETEALERSQIELSDLVISPSGYMLDWYRSIGIRLPERTAMINWFLPGWLPPYKGPEPLCTRAIKPGAACEFIFFGRHERRKGLEAFVEAIRQMKQQHPACDITFLGRFDQIDRENSVGYILRVLEITEVACGS